VEWLRNFETETLPTVRGVMGEFSPVRFTVTVRYSDKLNLMGDSTRQYSIRATTKMKQIMRKFCKEGGHDEGRVVFTYSATEITHEDTAESLLMTQGSEIMAEVTALPTPFPDEPVPTLNQKIGAFCRAEALNLAFANMGCGCAGGTGRKCDACGREEGCEGPGNPKRLRTCSCEAALYCDKACSTKGWKGHKSAHREAMGKAKGP
jgi:hypothetical protein